MARRPDDQACRIVADQAPVALERRPAPEAAETRQAELQSILDSSPSAILIADLHGNIRTCNLAVVEVLGCARDQILGKNFLTFVAPQDHLRVQEDIQRLLARGSLKNVQYSALRADGSPFVVDVSTGVVRSDAGEVTALVTIAADVTEREQAKASQRLSHRILEISNQYTLREPMLRQVVLAIRDFTQCQAVGIRILDREGNIPYEAYVGFSRGFYENESPLSIHSDHCMCINVVKGQTDPSLPFYTPHGSFYMNGTTRFLATVPEQDKGRTRNVCNETGFESVALIPIRCNKDILGLIHLADSREHRVPLSLVEILENVAMQLGAAVRRAMAEEALRKSEERFRAIVNNAAALVAVEDASGRWVHVNQYMLDLLGYSHGELMQIPGQDITHSEDRSRMKDVQERLWRGEIQQDRLEVRNVGKNGEILWVDLSLSALHDEQGRVEALLGVGFNVTEQKKAVEALRAAQKVAHVGNWTWHIPSNRLDWSDEMYRIFGIEKKDFSADLADITNRAIHPEDRARVEHANRRVIEERRHAPLEYRVVRPDESVRVVWAQAGELILDKDGNAAVLTGIVQDITDRKRAQQVLADSEERYRLLFDHMLSGIALHEVILDASGKCVDYRFLSVNAAFEKLTGLRADDILGRTVLEVMPGIESSWIARYGEVAMTGEPTRFEDFAQALNRHFDVRAYCPQRGQFVVVFHDITEQKQAERKAEQRQAQLLHVSRLSTLGEMASGFAHELNQPLSSIMSFASACLRSVQKGDFDSEKLVTNLERIVAQSSRAGDIIRRIRAFAQRRPPQLQAVTLNECVRDVLGLLQSNIRSAGVDVALDLSEDLPTILADPVQLEQVLVNLMRNAIEAMQGADSPLRRLAVRTFRPSWDLVAATVSDTGPGMDAQTMSQVFDPFFTTKDNGLGIGLSISRSIVESHRGHLSVAPGPHGGCAFTFTLSASQPIDATDPAEPATGSR
ncbi:MAG TPA: PAS domain S-box protein [Sedimentisphaerales bacterium]|nr:PAS domain S-box protein [Sedimentisphaerales bacterium]